MKEAAVEDRKDDAPDNQAADLSRQKELEKVSGPEMEWI
jgi:hypothetical protein